MSTGASKTKEPQKTGSNKGARFIDDDFFIGNKDPNYDYAYVLKKDVESGGGVTKTGYEPITVTNSSGETFGGIQSFFAKKTGVAKGSRVIEDVIAAKRPKEISQYFQSKEDEKYNSQVRLIKSTSRRVSTQLRDVAKSDESFVESESLFDGPGMTQRAGPTITE